MRSQLRESKGPNYKPDFSLTGYLMILSRNKSFCVMTSWLFLKAQVGIFYRCAHTWDWVGGREQVEVGVKQGQPG